MDIPDNLILKGKWTKADWSFYVSRDIPDDIPITAVFGLIHCKGKIVIVETKRGWELPGGHVESGETYGDALAREMMEEAGVQQITSAKPFGYTKITNLVDTINKASGELYPAQTCIMYFLIDFEGELADQNADDCFDRAMATTTDERIMASHMRDQILVGEGIFLFSK